MKFGHLLLQERIPEWAEAYIEYNILKKLLSPANFLQKKFVATTYKEGNTIYHITNRKNLRIDQVIICLRTFEYLIKNELIKIDKFFQYKMLDLIQRYKILMINTSFIRKSISTQQRLQNESKLKYSFKIFYKELNMVKDYIKLNDIALVKIMKKYQKSVKSLKKSLGEEFNLIKRIKAGKDTTYISRNQDKLKDLMKKAEDNYINYFYPDLSQQKNGRKDFRLYTTPIPLSKNQILFYGVFGGISCLLLLFIILKFIEVYSLGETSVQKTNLSQVFSLFRGNGLFLVFYWFLALNVHVWQNNHINYKLIFKFNHHFSQMYEILQRAAFFTFIYFVCFVWYLLLNSPHEKQEEGIDLYSLIDWIDMDYLPLIGWVILLFYVFFPFTNVSFFNPEGRKYFYKLLLDCLRSPFVLMEFKIAWMTDMLVSFAGPLKDFETTVCFYVSKAQGEYIDCKAEKRVTQFLLSIVPLIYRMVQCFRQGYDRKVFWRTWPFYNSIKYLFSLLTSLFSYFYTVSKNKDDFIIWLIFGAISTIYSFYWDIAQDWGLLKIGKTWKDTKLIGRKLYYGNKNFYLFAIFSNFILRIVWALNISLGLTDVIDQAMNIPGMFKFIIYSLELYRRCQWNFFRVELEHINNCVQYKAVVAIDLPVQIDMTSSTQDTGVKELELLPISFKNDEKMNKKALQQFNKDINPEFSLKNNQNENFEINSANNNLSVAKFSTKETENNKNSNAAFIQNSKGKINLNEEINEDSNQIIRRKPDLIYLSESPENNEQIQVYDAIKNDEKPYHLLDFQSQFKLDQEKIKSCLMQFQQQVQKGVLSEKVQEGLKVLKQIKPFLKSGQVNQVNIESEYTAYLTEEQQNLNP